MALETGEVIDGKYRIIREIGSGAMGAVYEGDNVRIHRRVAIKVLHTGIAARGDTVQRFEREAQAAGRIGSEHIVEVLDLGSLADGSYYMVMEFLEGMTLGQRIRSRGRLNPREVVPIVQQLLTGLEAAHDAKIIHRDLKPDNVFLIEQRGGGEFVKILDFGVSKFNPLNTEEGFNMTRTGAVVGTPFYMSPEQAKGARDVDQRSDLYAVGVILYQSITGQVPFHAGTFNELIFKIVLETPPPPEQFVPNLDANFSRIVRRAMAREPDQRFQTAAEFRDTLSVWLHTGNQNLGGTMVVQPPLPPPPGAPAAVALEAPTIMTQPKKGARAATAPLPAFAPMPVPAAPAQPAPQPAMEMGAMSPDARQREWILPTTTPTPPAGVPAARNNRRTVFAVSVALGVVAVAVTAIAGIAMTGRTDGAPAATNAAAETPRTKTEAESGAATTSASQAAPTPAASSAEQPTASAEASASASARVIDLDDPGQVAAVPPPETPGTTGGATTGGAAKAVDPGAAKVAPPPVAAGTPATTTKPPGTAKPDKSGRKYQTEL